MVKAKGVDAYLKRLQRLQGPDVVREVGQALFVGGEIIQRHAQISITTGSVSGKNHEPSKPGDPPNNDTGVLANNIETIQKDPLLVEVSSNAPYSAALEEGSSRPAGVTARPGYKRAGPVRYEFGDSKTEARPFMGPARDANRKKVEDLVAKAVERVSKR